MRGEVAAIFASILDTSKKAMEQHQAQEEIRKAQQGSG